MELAFDELENGKKRDYFQDFDDLIQTQKNRAAKQFTSMSQNKENLGTSYDQSGTIFVNQMLEDIDSLMNSKRGMKRALKHR